MHIHDLQEQHIKGGKAPNQVGWSYYLETLTLTYRNQRLNLGLGFQLFCPNLTSSITQPRVSLPELVEARSSQSSQSSQSSLLLPSSSSSHLSFFSWPPLSALQSLFN